MKNIILKFKNLNSKNEQKIKGYVTMINEDEQTQTLIKI